MTRRYVVWMPGAPDWRLDAAVDGPCISGGHRQVHELAVAIAATGRTVEVRGQFDLRELAELCRAAGTSVELPTEPRLPGPDDTVVMPEGFADPLTFGLPALTGARRILLIYAPPGFIGWPFLEGWSRKPPAEVALDEVARPEHFRSMQALGFELWTDSPPMAKWIEAAGVPVAYVGHGRPIPFPDPAPKRYDVITFASNRWADDARGVVCKLAPGVIHHEIPPSSNAEVLNQLGQARILIHPLRLEGASRIGVEARAMGAVPVVLNTNPFQVGLEEASGAMAVGTLEEMARAVTDLLADSARLAELRERGMRMAREQFAWDPHVALVDKALARPAPDDPGREARSAIGARLRQGAAARDAEISRLRSELDDALGAVYRLEGDRVDLIRALGEATDRLDSIRSSRGWRAIARYRHARDLLRAIVQRR